MVALICAGVGHFLSVDLFVVVAELRLDMMFLVLRPIFLGHSRPRAPITSGFPPGREAHKKSLALFEKTCWEEQEK